MLDDAQRFVSCLVVIGVLAQAGAMCRQLKSALSSSERFGLIFAIAWRFGVSLMLAEYQLVKWYFPIERQLELRLFPWPQNVLYYLPLLVVLPSLRFYHEKGEVQRFRSLRTGLFFVTAVGLVTYAAYNHLFISYLSSRSIRGLVTLPRLNAVTEPAFWLAIAAVCWIPINLILLRRAAASSETCQLRTAWIRFAIGFSAMTGLFLANYLVVLPAAAPFLLEQEFDGSRWHLLMGVPCFLTLVTGVTYQFVHKGRGEFAIEGTLQDRTTIHLFPHQRRWVVMALAAVILIQFIWLIAANLDQDFLSYVPYFLCLDEYPAQLALTLLAVQKAWQSWRYEPLRTAVAELPPLHFAAVWLATAMFWAVAIPVIAIYGFALVMLIWT